MSNNASSLVAESVTPPGAGTPNTVSPIAIVGVGCRFAGGVDSPEALWDLLESGGNAVREVPPERWDVAEVYDPQPGIPGKTVSRWGGFLDQIGGFDTAGLGITQYEAQAMDPQHRLLVEMSWEALEHAGIAPSSLMGSQTGVYFGIAHHDYLLRTFDESLVDNPYVMTGNAHSVAAGRVSYLLGLHGPSVAVDTACSSGLLSVHLACQSLRAGEVDLALAGAAMLMLGPEVGVLFSQWSMLSPNGRCAAFDADADGFVRSEGCAVIALQRLDDALRDGHRVLAVIRGSAANSDGRSDNIVVPSASAQEAVQRRALAVAAVDPATVELVEAHGPGTPTGDPVEFRALSAVYGPGDKPCAVGSVKTNIGHTESVSGLAGLIKTVMSLRNGKIPGNLHFKEWNPDISVEGTRLFVPTALTEWPRNGSPRLAAVSSYGFSGTNVHVVVEEAPQTSTSAASSEEHTRPYLLSASTPQALADTAGRIAEWLADKGSRVPLQDVGYTLARGREHRGERLVALASSRSELIYQLTAAAESQPASGVISGSIGASGPGSVWLFSGQGSQWAGMGRTLLETEPAFAAVIDQIEPLIAAEAGFSVRGELTGQDTVTGIDRVQPTIFAMQVALAAAWRSHGVEPSAVIGHSLGEVAAAVVAGALSVQDGVKVICRRSSLVMRISGIGAMATVELAHHKVEVELAEADIHDVTVAVVASPSSTVVAGSPERIQQLIAGWEARDLHTRQIAVDYASHCPQVDPILADLRAALAEVSPVPARVLVYSTVLDDPRATAAFDAQYWSHNLRQPVRFADAVTAALLDGHRTFIEVSPHPLLTHAASETAHAAGRDAVVVPTLRRDQDQTQGLLPQLAELHCKGVPVDWSRHYPSGTPAEAPLPAWAGRDLGIQALKLQRPGQLTVPTHPLLGAYVQSIGTDEHHWRGHLDANTPNWVADHRVHGQPVMPGAAYAEMALSAAQEIFDDGPESTDTHTPAAEILDLAIHEMLHLDERTPVYTHAYATADHDLIRFETLTRRDDEEPTQLATGLLHRWTPEKTTTHDITELLAAHPDSLNPNAAYAKFQSAGVEHDDKFAVMTAIHLSPEPGLDQTILTEITLPAPIRAQLNSYRIHPVLLDGCLQTLAAHPALIRDAFPVAVGALQLYGIPHQARYCLARLRHLDSQEATGDVTLLNDDGTVVAQINGIRLATQDRRMAERLLTISWERTEDTHAELGTEQPWLIATEDSAPDTLATDLMAALAGAEGAKHQLLVGYSIDKLAAQLSNEQPEHLVLLCPATELDGPAAIADAEHRARQLIDIVRLLAEHTEGHQPRLWVITRNAQPVTDGDGTNLAQSSLRGLCRVIGHEHPELRICNIDIEPGTTGKQLAAALRSAGDADEIAVRSGKTHLARLKIAPLHDDERKTATVEYEHDRIALAVRHVGDLGSLELITAPRRQPGPDEIEIHAGAFGLNYADVLNAMGLYKTVDGRPMPFGFDCAGTVTAVGQNVTTHRVGDRVAAMHPGAFNSFVVVPAVKAHAIPADVSDEEAAARPSVYATAWYALNRLCHLRAGERVLIHSATGGVGLAAVSIAQMLGAEVFATAGTPGKRQYLRDLGITNVFDSRSTKFATEIRDLTGQEGVDVVLNSLTGAAQRAGLDLLRIGGRFVELGKKDIYADTRIGLYPFRRNISLHSVDLGVLEYDHLGDILGEVHKLLNVGALKPTPHTTYPLHEASTAFRTLAAGGHIGKLVLTVPRTGVDNATIRPQDVPVIRRDGAYIVTGGLGGLGILLATWLAEGGARRIVLNGRSEPNQYAREVIEQLRAAGTEIEVVLGDISADGTAEHLVSAATATDTPLRGVIHGAAVIDDGAITTVTSEQFTRVWAPKALGAFRLHQATEDAPLDWWFGFSSASAMLGFPGQASYAAANALLDGLIRWRRGQGLPAVAVNWGAWADHGRGVMFADRGNTMIEPNEGITACQTVLQYNRAQSGYLAILDPNWQAMFAEKFRTSPFFAAIPAHNAIGLTATAGQDDAIEQLRHAEPASRQILLERHLTEHAAEILRVNSTSLDPDRSLTDHGLDSLMSLELSTRIDREYHVRLTPKQMRQDSSPAALAARILAQLSLGKAG
ncbi:type I polyketide synthase [Mycobacteroides abscessus]|uniref:type I polyketide synthase n=2 Tax=Mycobacteroides abscessus TaxID=36809 RepID=UPI0021053748|nr:type I polyketide synthase [Mycobacteroides abscessus]